LFPSRSLSAYDSPRGGKGKKERGEKEEKGEEKCDVRVRFRFALVTRLSTRQEKK